MHSFAQKMIRRETGSLSGPLLALSLVIGVTIGALAVDFGHAGMVRTQLQNATDAAALAGAQDLYTNPDLAENHALSVASSNQANGQAVSNSSGGTAVSVQVTRPNLINGGRVEVTASMSISHLLAPIFGRFSDVLVARSVAGGSSVLKRLNQGQGFPLAVSLYAASADGLPLRNHQLGDTVQLTINSQQNKNAAWTSYTVDPPNSSFISNAIDSSLGLSDQNPFFIPPVQIGDQINLLNGIAGQMELGRQSPEHDALLNAPLVLVAVVADLPPMNQTSQVIGFVGLHVTGVELDQNHGQVLTITGTLLPASASGDDCPSCPDGPNDGNLEMISARSIGLLE